MYYAALPGYRSRLSVPARVERHPTQSHEGRKLPGVAHLDGRPPQIIRARPEDVFRQGREDDPGVLFDFLLQLPRTPTGIVGNHQGRLGLLAEDVLDFRGFEGLEDTRDHLTVGHRFNRMEARHRTRYRPAEVQRLI